MSSTGCEREANEVNYLEHIQVVLDMSHPQRGDVQVALLSPHGMKTTLIHARPNDKSADGFRMWPLLTVHNWGESPRGTWVVSIGDIVCSLLLLPRYAQIGIGMNRITHE